MARTYQLLPSVKEGMLKSGLHECGLSLGTVNGVEQQCMSSAEKSEWVIKEMSSEVRPPCHESNVTLLSQKKCSHACWSVKI